MQHLRIAESILGLPARRKWHVRRLERRHPVRRRLRRHHLRHRCADFGVIFRRLAATALVEARLQDQLAEPDQLGGNGDEIDMHAAKLNVVAIGAAVVAVERRAARWMRLEYMPRQSLANDLRVVKQRASHQ